MRPTIDYTAHIKLEKELQEFIAKGGKIRQAQKATVKSIGEKATPKQIRGIDTWCKLNRGRRELLRMRVEEKVKMDTPTWLKNLLSANRTCSIELYEIILGEMYD